MSKISWDFLLNDYGVSYYYYYFQPTIAIISTVLNLISSRVLASRKLRESDKFFQYSLVNSIGALIVSFIKIFMFVSRCGGSICSLSESYWAQIYIVCIVNYICGTYYFGTAMIQIVIGANVYVRIVRKFSWINRFSAYKTCAFIFGKF